MRKEIINLINKNISMKEISRYLNISEKELWIKIKQLISNGYNIDLKYHINSNINFEINRDIEEKQEQKIFIPSDIKEVRFIAVSDLHVGDKDSDLKLADSVYNYAVKNGINTIFIGGDIIQGNYNKPIDLTDIENQTETFIKKYPYDKNILNYYILGNHDYRPLYYSGLDISRRISNVRYDMIYLGNGIGNICLKDDLITLKHDLECVDLDISTILGNVVLCGHSHMMRIKLNGKLYIYIPSLSYNSPDKSRENVPGFLDINLEFDRKKIGSINIDYLLINSSVQKVSENKIKIKSINCN